MSLVGDGERVRVLVDELRREFPRLRFVDKESDPLSIAIDRLLRWLTLGGQSAYMTHYVTTLGASIYLPLGWRSRSEEDRYITLRHEAVHLRQFRRYTWPGMSLLYLLPLLPMGLALGRARIEWEAYAETLRAVAEVRGLDSARDSDLHERIVRQFTSAAYGWMWPFPKQVRAWIGREVAALERSTAPRRPS